MTLVAGTKLGSYEVLSPIGSGGMGEGYRARDTKLNRDVALKVLPEAFAKDAERMARFQREAQVLASLNHPNIAAIYGFEESGGVRALVMELVEGSTLAAVIMKEPDWEKLPPSVPAAIQKLLRRCLDKDPKRRLQAIGEARIAIEETLSGTPEVGADERRPHSGFRRTHARPHLALPATALMRRMSD